MKNNTNKVIKLDEAKNQLSEYKGFKELQKSVGGLSTITDISFDEFIKDFKTFFSKHKIFEIFVVFDSNYRHLGSQPTNENSLRRSKNNEILKNHQISLSSNFQTSCAC